MTHNEKYECEIGKDGSKGLELLDLVFNPSTTAFIARNGIKPGMKVLDVGCGTGVMSRWLAQKVGESGKVIAIDNSADQVHAAQKATDKQWQNIEYLTLSAYDILSLNQTFDLIYCRFVLHHLHSPRSTIKLFYDALNLNGIYIGEEGLVNAAFAYPPTFAWNGYMPELKHPSEERDDEGRDGDFGMKLYYYAKQSGFSIVDCHLAQPLLWKKEQKIHLLNGLKEFKKTELSHGTTEETWQKKYHETERLIEDDNQIIGFYGSCQVAAKKT